MIIKQEPILFARQQLILTNQRALYWEQRRTLILSDLHLGKAAHFRKNGIPMSGRIGIDDLKRLEELILFFDARNVLIVGDLVHAGANNEVALFGQLRDRFSGIDFLLVKGNHDRFPKHLLPELGINAVFDELVIEGIHFIHHPEQHHSGRYTISGHIHPGVSVRMPDKKVMQFPCFAVTDVQLILPAFSKFTGTDTRSLPRGVRCYAFYDTGIFEVLVS